MKYFWLLAFLFGIEAAYAHAITVTGIKVSVTADSAATAREEALEQAHSLAFQKLLQEHFPEKSSSLPSHDKLMNLVTDFSIDREKTTPTSYTASLTFQFDGPRVQAWVQQGQSLSQGKLLSEHSPKGGGSPLKVKASYTTFAEWQHIRKTLEKLPGVEKVNVLSLSSNGADVEIICQGNIEKLQQNLLEHRLLLSPQEKGWLISSNVPSLH